jgi:hypothetical protein
MQIDNLILGHNSFFGINHIDYDKGKNTNLKFQNLNKIIDIIEFSVSNGIKNFMISTLEQAPSFINMLSDKNIKDLNFYILLPYINKYVRKSNELGLLGLIKDIAKNKSFYENLSQGSEIGTFLLKGNYEKLIPTLIDIELNSFKNVNKKTIILHDALTDILIALKRIDVIDFFLDTVKKKFNCIPGLATKNFPRLYEYEKKLTNDSFFVLTHGNKLGFNMNPNKALVEECFNKTKLNLIMMSVFASGYLNAKDASQYVNSFKNDKIEVVAGCSTKEHIMDYINYFCEKKR